MALAGLLSVLQLADSGFPSGRYTLSYGLESIAESGELPSPAGSSVARLLGDALRFGVAPSDGVALGCAHRAVGLGGLVDLEAVTHADGRLTAVKLAREGREASRRTGRALLHTVIDAFGGTLLGDYAELVRAGRCPCNHAVVMGMASAWLDVPRSEAIAGDLYAFAAGWVAAAVRLALIDHRTAQTILCRVRPVIGDLASRTSEGDVSDISSCTPLLDVMSMRHEEAELRLFAS
jgi:urease accessory protein